MSRQDALAAARRTFGNVARTQERFYESNRWIWWDQLRRDAGYALRQMRRAPVATVIVVLSLALGVGFNTAIFSLTDQALIRPLPVAEPEQLVRLDWNGRFIGGGLGFGSLLPHPFYRDLRAEHRDIFVDVFARAPTSMLLSIGEQTEQVTVEAVTGSYFSTLGVRSIIGRLFADDDDLTPGAHPLVVLSHDTWRSRLGADSSIIGRQIRLNGHAMTVVGVTQPGFFGLDWSEVPALWIPMMMYDQVTSGDRLLDRRERFVHAFGRLRNGMSRTEAMDQLQPWFKNYLRADMAREGWPPVTEQHTNEYLASRLEVLPASSGYARGGLRMHDPMLILLAASGLILVLACLNVANLSLARTLARRRATALRTALGASRRRIVLEQFVESSMLAFTGCLAGVLIAPFITRSILPYLPTPYGGAIGLSPDLDIRVLAFALAIAAVTTVLSGTAPAHYAASVHPTGALTERSTGLTAGLGLRKALVVGQFALALILLIGAGLFARTLGALRERGPGFPTTNLLMFTVSPASVGYGAQESKTAIRTLLAEIRALPDVAGASVGIFRMLYGGGWNNPVTIQATERLATEESLRMKAVSSGFFETLGVPVVRGRDFGTQDVREQPGWGMRSAIVNQEFVDRYLPAVEPLGTRIAIGSSPDLIPDIEIVGVVPSFQDRGLRDPEAHVFFSIWERSVGGGTFYVRTRGSSDAAVGSIRSTIRNVDSRLAIGSLSTIDDQLDQLLASERMLSVSSAAFATVASLLAMIGLYGVLSFSATLRMKEMGIRIALGARHWAAGGLIVREAAGLAAIGITIALPVTWALGRFIESQLFGVRPMDPAAILMAASGLAIVCIIASAGPARRASSIDPIQTLQRD
jgi:predicted permease